MRAVAGLLGVAAVSLGLVRLHGAAFQWSLWSDRDLVRAWRAIGTVPTLGAELSYGDGARVPGGALEALLQVPMVLTLDERWIWRWQVGLEGLGAALLAVWAGRRAGPVAASTSAIVLLSARAVEETSLKLWNPGFVPVFVAIALVAALRASDRRSRGSALVAGAAVGIGLQLHLSVLAPGLALGAVAARGSLAAFALGLVLPFLPYLAVEAASGWPNTSLLLGQPYVADAGGTMSGARGAEHALLWLTGQTPDPRFGVGPSPAWSVAAATLAGVGTAVAAVAGARERRVLAVAALGLLGVVLDSRAEVGGRNGLRYVVASAPAVALLAGLGAGRLARTRSGAALVLASGLAGVGLVGARSLGLHRPVDSHARFVARVGAARAALGGVSLADAAGRTAWIAVDPRGGIQPGPDAPVDWWLTRAGQSFPGSAPGPCALLVDGPDTLWDGEAPRADVGRRLLPDRRVDVVGGAREVGLVLVDVDGRCPSSMSDRYLATSDEEAAWRAVARRAGAVERLPDGAWAVGLGVDGRVAALHLRVDPVGERIVVRVASNQLRGKAYNGGFFDDLAVTRPRVVLDGPARVEVPLATATLGAGGELTPVTVVADVGRGAWRVSVEADGMERVEVGEIVVP